MNTFFIIYFCLYASRVHLFFFLFRSTKTSTYLLSYPAGFFFLVDMGLISFSCLLFFFFQLITLVGEFVVFSFFPLAHFFFFLSHIIGLAFFLHLFSSPSPFKISNSLFAPLSLTGSRSILCGFSFPSVALYSSLFSPVFFFPRKYHKGLTWVGYVDIDELMVSQ